MNRRLLSLVAFPILLAAAEPHFKVIIITTPARNVSYPYTGFQFKDDQIVWGTLLTLKQMIKHAYHLTDEQLIGGPEWTSKELFDVTANAEEPTPMAGLDAMLRTLLAERFHLKVHRETRTMPAYVLTVDKSGSNLTPVAEPDGFAIPVKTVGVGKRPGTLAVQSSGGTMPQLALVLGRMERRPVVDRTGLDQFYNFRLEFMLSAPPHQELQRKWAPQGPYLSDALRDQLGLRLDSKKVPVEVLVIDHAEKPTLDILPSNASPSA
jgi:uncharacterized protein (TIGR03435 family)